MLCRALGLPEKHETGIVSLNEEKMLNYSINIDDFGTISTIYGMTVPPALTFRSRPNFPHTGILRRGAFSAWAMNPLCIVIRKVLSNKLYRG